MDTPLKADGKEKLLVVNGWMFYYTITTRSESDLNRLVIRENLTDMKEEYPIDKSYSITERRIRNLIRNDIINPKEGGIK